MNDLGDAKVRPWYRRPLALVWLLLAIISFGLLAPSWIAQVRLLKRRTQLWLFNLISILVGLFSNIPALTISVWIVGLTLSLVLKEKDYSKYLVQADTKKKASESEPSQTSIPAREKEDAPLATTNRDPQSANDVISPKNEPKISKKTARVKPKELKAQNKTRFSDWIKFEFSVRRKVRKLQKRVAFQNQYIVIVQENLKSFQDKVSKFDFHQLNSQHELNLIEVVDCALIETRKGARVTVRESTYSGGYGGGSVRVGAFSVGGGRSSGSSSSTSISYPAPDELQMIDKGKFILTNLKASIVGSMFTKTTEFKKLVDYATQGRQILFAPKTGTKVWIVEFPNFVDAWIVSCLLATAFETPERRLDHKATNTVGSLEDSLKSQFKRAVVELEVTLNDGRNELKNLLESYSEFQRQFPTKLAALK